MALVRVYCGLASADESVRAASAAQLTIAVVDDAGRLLGVHEISDDPGGYAELGALLVARTSGFTDAAVAVDSDDHVVTSLLTAAGRPLVVADDDSTDDFAERFADDSSIEEMQAPPAARRAVGLARALQAGAITAVNLQTPRELVSYKPILAAHVALLNGRHGAAVALREVLRELYPAALRAYPDPAHPLAMAVLDALPEPSKLSIGGAEAERVAEQIVSELSRSRAGTEDEIIAAVTALSVAISESPRRGGVNKSLAPSAAKSIRHAIGAVRACDAACDELIGTLAERAPAVAGQGVGRRARRGAEPAPLQSVPTGDANRFGGRRSRPEPATTGNGPVIPQPLNNPPAAPEPMMPPPLAPRPVTPPPAVPAASTAFPNRAPAPGNRPVSVPPPPPGMTPITPGSRPPSRMPGPVAPTSAPVAPAASFNAPAASMNAPTSASPADSGQPFRATLSHAAINSARAERRTVIPPRPTNTPRPSSPAAPGSATDYSLPMPTQRPGSEMAEPGSRANWPLMNPSEDAPAASISSPPSGHGLNGSGLSGPGLGGPGLSSPGLGRGGSGLGGSGRGGSGRGGPGLGGPGLSDPGLSDPGLNGAGLSNPGLNGAGLGGPGANGSGLNGPGLNGPGLNGTGRVKPPWQDMPKEPPALRLVEPQLGDRRDVTVTDLPAISDPPALRVVEGDGARNGRVRRGVVSASASIMSNTGSTLTALDRSTNPPVPAESNDGDLLIFAAARSAWFTGHAEVTPDLNWANPNDTGWRAAEKAATPEVAAETAAGLPKRVPQANLVPGSPLREERPLRIVRDAASIAAHTTGYFRGWRRGQEIGGFAMGGRPGRESAGGWDFTRDGQSADDYRNSEAGYRR